MRPLRNWRDGLQLPDADDVDSPVAAIFETEDSKPADDAVLDDPVEIPTDQLLMALGPHARGDADFSMLSTPRDAYAKRFGVAAAERDLGQMELGHEAGLAREGVGLQ